MTLRTRALDPASEVVDESRRWTPEWYTFISSVSLVGKVIDLPINRVDPITGQPIRVVDVGARALVTDATAVTFGTGVLGGGSNTVPVYFDGLVWRIG